MTLIDFPADTPRVSELIAPSAELPAAAAAALLRRAEEAAQGASGVLLMGTWPQLGCGVLGVLESCFLFCFCFCGGGGGVGVFLWVGVLLGEAREAQGCGRPPLWWGLLF